MKGVLYSRRFKARELNITALDNNVTVLEDNITVAQLLQTLDADGNASNGIQILDGTDRVVMIQYLI